MFISVFSFFCVQAQKNVSKQLNDVLVSHDMTKGEKLLSKISEADIANMPDSVLLDYHYLAGGVADNKGNTEMAIDHLLKFKDICENKIGIFNDIHRYLEIMRALGDLYEDLKKDDEALLFYEEGIVKAFAFMQSKDDDLQGYIKELRDNAADILEKQGHHEMAISIHSGKQLDYEKTFDYGCDLASQATNLYKEGKAIEALPLLDEAKDIFQNCGKDGKDMMQPLYRDYLMCYSQIGDVKRIDKLLQYKKNLIFYANGKSYLASDMGELIGNFLVRHHDVNTATKYYNYFIKEHDESNSEDIVAVENLRNNIEMFKLVYIRIDSLEQVRNSLSHNSYEWGKTSLQLANQLIRIQRQSEGNDICKEVYLYSSKLDNDPDKLHWYVLMNLTDYCLDKKDMGNAEIYLKEQLTWLDTHNVDDGNKERGWVYNKLGIAYMNSKNYDECHKAFDKAEKIFIAIYTKTSSEYAIILHNKGRLAQLEGNLDEAKSLLTEAKELQISVNGKSLDRTEQYLDEVEHAIKVRL